MKANKLPSVDRIKQVLNYSPDTGTFTWKETLSNASRAGKLAGTKGGKGYIHICLDRTRYPASRLAWLYMTGQDPANFEIDHINRVRDDNRFCNLRLADRTTNCRNINVPRHNTSGVKGVYRHSRSRRWEAYIHVKRRRVYIGTFDEFSDAVAARLAAEDQFLRGIGADAGDVKQPDQGEANAA